MNRCMTTNNQKSAWNIVIYLNIMLETYCSEILSSHSSGIIPSIHMRNTPFV